MNFNPCKSVLSAFSVVRFGFWSSPRVKVIIRGIAALELLFPARLAALRSRRRQSARRIDALYRRHPPESSLAGVAGDRHQKPRDRRAIRSVDLGRHLPCNLAAIIELPCGTTKMPPDRLPLLIQQLCFGRLQRPNRLAFGIGTANIDLKSRCARTIKTSSWPAGGWMASGTLGFCTAQILAGTSFPFPQTLYVPECLPGRVLLFRSPDHPITGSPGSCCQSLEILI